MREESSDIQPHHSFIPKPAKERTDLEQSFRVVDS